MAISSCTVDTNVISALADAPALTASELKAKFDEAGTGIKGYINNTLISDINSTITSTANTINGTITTNQTSNNNRLTALEGDMTTAKSNITTLQGNVTTINGQISTLSSGKQKVITSGTSAPSGGSDGDIYIQYF